MVAHPSVQFYSLSRRGLSNPGEDPNASRQARPDQADRTWLARGPLSLLSTSKLTC